VGRVPARVAEPSPPGRADVGDCGRLWGTMRVFLPSTLPALARALRTGQVDAGQVDAGQQGAGRQGAGRIPMPGFAVTPALREAYASGDAEELEYAALTAAARASLRMLAADPAAPPRRLVLAAELPAAQVRPDPLDAEPGRVTVMAPVPLENLVSAHVDDPDAAADMRRAAAGVRRAAAGGADVGFDVDRAEGHELAWYAVQELPELAAGAT
jgi:hypothetical protein